MKSLPRAAKPRRASAGRCHGRRVQRTPEIRGRLQERGRPVSPERAPRGQRGEQAGADPDREPRVTKPGGDRRSVTPTSHVHASAYVARTNSSGERNLRQLVTRPAAALRPPSPATSQRRPPSSVTGRFGQRRAATDRTPVASALRGVGPPVRRPDPRSATRPPRAGAYAAAACRPSTQRGQGR